MFDDSESIMGLDLQLSDQEIFYIGMIVAHWGSLEHEVFNQTLASFYKENEQTGSLPKAMNNIQFSKVLSLWKERVVNQSEPDVSRVLSEVHDAIYELKDTRDALIHGMWQWSPSSPNRISTVRVRKNEVITTHFNSAFLEDLALRLSRLNFMVHYPRGVEDLAASRQGAGFYMSRRAIEMLAAAAKKPVA